MHSTHWAAILGEVGIAVGICVAAVAARFAQKTSSRSVKVTETMATIENDRRYAERIPRLSGRLEAWGAGSEDLLLSVWLETPEALGRLRVLIQEARNMDGPVGFKPGQTGVDHELPWPQEHDETEGVLPAWRPDSLRPVADWPDRMAPGSAAVWGMQLRRTADMGGGSVAVRLKALCWADRDDQVWETVVPVTFSDRARDMIDTACKNSDH